jgi:hypothetical protein
VTYAIIIHDEDILLQKIKDDKAVTNKQSDGELSVVEKSLSVDRTVNSVQVMTAY